MGVGGARHSGWAEALVAGALVLALLSLLTGGLGWLTGAELLGAGTADLWGHALGYGQVARQLARGLAPGLDLPLRWPEGQRWWIIDLPVAVAVAPLTAGLGPMAATNVALAGHLVLGASALAAGLRRRGVGAVAAVGAGLLVAFSPYCRGALHSGVPESLVVLLLPVGLALLSRALQRGGPWVPGAGIFGAIMALDGPYGVFVVGLGGALCLGWALVRPPVEGPSRARLLARGLLAALPAAVAALGARAALVATQHPALAQADRRDLGWTADWVLRGIGGVDLACFFLPAQLLPATTDATGHRHIAYVGLVAVVAAAGAAWRCRASRAPALLALLAGLLALGDTLRLWGQPVGPAWLPGRLLWELGASNLYRLAGLVPLGLVVAVALAWRRGPALGALMLAVGLEWAVGAPLPLRLPTTPNPSGPVEAWLRAQATAGAVLDLPVDLEGTLSAGPFPQRTFALQAVHGRPIASGLYADAPALGLDPALAAMGSALARLSRRAPAGQVVAPSKGPRMGGPLRLPRPPQAEGGRRLSAALADRGFAFVTLDLERVPDDHRADAQAWVEAWLGAPALRSGDRAVWRIPTDSVGGVD